MTQRTHKNRLGISRSRFSDYLKCKNKRQRSISRKRFSKKSLRKMQDQQQMADSSMLSYSTKTSEIQLTQINEPNWMTDYRKCCMLLAEVDAIMDQVKQQKEKKVKAVNQQRHRKAIQKLYAQSSSKIQNCQKILKSIQKGANVGAVPQQRKIFTNTIMSIAMRTRQRAKDIRQAQQQDLKQRQELRKFQSLNLDANDLMNKDEQSVEYFSEQGLQALQQQLSNQRNEQILKIVASIHSLNTIYKQLQQIVIQQGSLLDRIDQNINTAAFNVKQANEHLTKAEEHQKSPVANRIIFVLVLLIVACTLILAFR